MKIFTLRQGLALGIFASMPLLLGNPARADISALQQQSTSCPPTPFQVCGSNFWAAAGPLGTIQTLTMPDRFQMTNFAVQCVTTGGLPYYQYAAGPVNCTLKTCATPATVSVCDTSIPVSAETQVGSSIEVALPESMVALDDDEAAPSVTARCDIVNGEPQYRVTDDHGLSCNVFLCQPVRLNICDSIVVISQSAKLGSLIKLTTASGVPVTAQCLGSDTTPHYVITDNNCH